MLSFDFGIKGYKWLFLMDLDVKKVKVLDGEGKFW